MHLDVRRDLPHFGYPVTNIRNTTSPHWRGWLKPESRCLVPATEHCRPVPELTRSGGIQLNE
jgi:putative SOS response-associated peptidase YedK